MSKALQLKLGIAVALSCIAADASAQQRILRRNERAGNQPRTSQNIQQTSGTAIEGQSGQSIDNQFAACLLQANEGEIKLGKLAAERAESKDVKEFADQMVKDHSALAEKLEHIVGTQRPNDRRSQIEKQINDRCLAMFEEELESKSGKEFDACYVGSQIGGHMHMIAALEVLSNESSGQLQQIAKDALPTVQQHYEHAKKLMKQVDERQVSKN